MNRSIKFIICIHFNNLNWRPNIPRLSPDWIEARMEIFMHYTYQSLRAQTNQNFEAFIYYDPTSEQDIQNSLSHYPPLPNHIHFLPYILETRNYNSLIKDYEFLYYTALDSDNMYHSSYIQFLQDYIPKEDTQFIALSNGYGYNARNGDLAYYHAPVEYLYTHVYRTSEYLKGHRHTKIPLGTKPSAKEVPHEVITDRNMFVLTWHGGNVINSCNFLVSPSQMIKDPEEVSQIWHGFTGETKPYILQLPEVL